MMRFAFAIPFSIFLVAVIEFAIAPAIASAVPPQNEPVVVATVDDQPISLNEVHRFLDQAFLHVPGLANRKDRDEATVDAGIAHCIDREIVFAYLQTTKYKTTNVESQLEKQRRRLEQTDQKLEDFLAEVKLSEAEYRRELKRKRSWQKYGRNVITESHLRKRFEERRRFYDGTEINVAQILWKSTDEATLQLAADVRNQLQDGSLSWKDAVAKHSQSASAATGGELGFIGFDGPMPRKFTDAAFDLKAGENSQPFTSQFGTHLIRCLEVRDGTATFEDIVERIRDDETKRLFAATVARHRDKVQVKRN